MADAADADLLQSGKQAEVAAKLATGKQKKDAGDAAFKSGDVKAALRSYHESLLWIMGLDKTALPGYKAPEPPADGKEKEKEKSEVDDMLEKVHSNVAACHIKLGNWKRALEASDKTLKKNEDNYKAMFRKGKALGELGYFEKAEKVLSELLKKNPSDEAAIKAEMERLNAMDKVREKEHSKKYKGFLNKEKAKTEGLSGGDDDQMEPLSGGPVPSASIEEVPVEAEPADDDDDD